MRSRRWSGVAWGTVFAVVACCMLLAAPGAALAQAQVAVFPSPNTTSALPQTQITFRGVPASQIGHVTVTGSSSGAHSGTIEADSDGQGGSFIPSTPFTAGETVTVTTGLDVINGTSGSFHFGIATPFGTINPMNLPMVPAGSNGVQHFHSRPDLEPASITVNKHSSSEAPGDIFVTPQYGPVQNGPMILDSSGRTLWFQPLGANQLATDFRVQQLNGQPVLTWWQGYTNNGSGRGEGVILNTQYQQIATVQAANGLQGMDLHEFLVTPQGDAYIVGVSPVHYPGMGRPLMDSVVQEIDIKTGLVLFEWHALDHIPITESFFKKGAPGYVYDPYHLNSVALDTDGNLIISMRNTWAVYKVDHNTGAVIWTLGSNQNNFKMGAGTQTAFQHDVLVQPNGVFTAFDDGGGPPTVRQARAVELSVNENSKTVTLAKQFEHSPGLKTNFEGGAQVLPDGDLFVGWGQQPYFTEFNSAGQEVFDARFTSNTSSYRAYKLPWSADPGGTPIMTLAPNNDGTTELWTSWNGATAIASWRVLAGTSARTLVPLQTANWTGFETSIAAPTGVGDFEVQALDSSGNVLGTSPMATAKPHIGVAGRTAFVGGGGTGGLPAICDNGRTCHISVTATVGRTVVARTGSEQIPANGGGIIYFTLNGAGRSMLAHARGHRLLVRLSGSASKTLTLNRFITLVPFSTRGASPAHSASQSSTLRILGLTDFVSSGGTGGILAECLASTPCHTKTTVSVGNTVIASTGSELLGARDVGYLIFSLTSAGRSMLARAHGNQLGASVTITDGGATAHGSISLVGFR
ncbi:MAG TPA: arylsulfotransferase family protein [Solirubrobacteraceae bacterium]|nr:arylsulfotransferase family protein [Solirubrobacteraceae bacterium]